MGIQCVWNNSYPLLTYLTKERINACEELLEIFCVFIPFWYRKKKRFIFHSGPHFYISWCTCLIFISTSGDGTIVCAITATLCLAQNLQTGSLQSNQT